MSLTAKPEEVKNGLYQVEVIATGRVVLTGDWTNCDSYCRSSNLSMQRICFAVHPTNKERNPIGDSEMCCVVGNHSKRVLYTDTRKACEKFCGNDKEYFKVIPVSESGSYTKLGAINPPKEVKTEKPQKPYGALLDNYLK